MSALMEQDTVRQRWRDASGKLLYGILHWGGLAAIVYCGWNVLAEVANGIRDWWHGGDREYVSLWWIAGIVIGGLMSAWGESGLQDIRAALTERHATRLKRLDEFQRKQAEENRRYDRIEFADDRARERMANLDNSDWKERRIPEELWEGSTVRSERLREWGFLLGEGWDDIDHDE